MKISKLEDCNHIIKYDHEDGEKLDNPVSWCGKSLDHGHWFFRDAAHYALAKDQGSLVAARACEECKNKIIEAINK